MLKRLASAPDTSSTTAAQRPAQGASRSGSQPVSSRAMQAAEATLRNS